MRPDSVVSEKADSFMAAQSHSMRPDRSGALGITVTTEQLPRQRVGPGLNKPKGRDCGQVFLPVPWVLEPPTSGRVRCPLESINETVGEPGSQFGVRDGV